MYYLVYLSKDKVKPHQNVKKKSPKNIESNGPNVSPFSPLTLADQATNFSFIHKKPHMQFLDNACKSSNKL